jgi:hypothetical protein
MSSRRTITWAVALWLVFALAVWNVVFDRIIVLAGRRYSHDAVVLYQTSHRYLLIDEVMRPAIAHALRVASVTAAAIAVAGLLLIRVAAARDARVPSSRADDKDAVA